MTPMELIDIMGKLRSRWPDIDDVEEWERVLSRASFADCRRVLNELAAGETVPSWTDMTGLLPDPNLISEEDRAIGLARINELRALMVRSTERNR